jgi:hypothetical protein
MHRLAMRYDRKIEWEGAPFVLYRAAPASPSTRQKCQ